MQDEPNQILQSFQSATMWLMVVVAIGSVCLTFHDMTTIVLLLSYDQMEIGEYFESSLA